MGSGKNKKKEQTPSVASMFRTPGSMQSDSQHTEDEDSGPEEGTHTSDPMVPLTIGILRGMLTKATADIKSHVASEINKQLAVLKADVTALSTRTDQTETLISTLTATITAHTQEIAYFCSWMTALEDSLEDLNNRSRRNNIQIRAYPTRTIDPHSKSHLQSSSTGTHGMGLRNGQGAPGLKTSDSQPVHPQGCYHLATLFSG
ncbi:Hypothetical predicted protein [Pelobates cultripes]|uniref:Uncharacterized protein n=1 Tax=Pelobates cultripes TaxID=61616 RepID=A0AAD1WSQ0_PELCU|nr:Hypothetical predicted protein [Pelobates cultripes]